MLTYNPRDYLFCKYLEYLAFNFHDIYASPCHYRSRLLRVETADCPAGDIINRNNARKTGYSYTALTVNFHRQSCIPDMTEADILKSIYIAESFPIVIGLIDINRLFGHIQIQS